MNKLLRSDVFQCKIIRRQMTVRPFVLIELVSTADASGLVLFELPLGAAVAAATDTTEPD